MEILYFWNWLNLSNEHKFQFISITRETQFKHDGKFQMGIYLYFTNEEINGVCIGRIHFSCS